MKSVSVRYTPKLIVVDLSQVIVAPGVLPVMKKKTVQKGKGTKLQKKGSKDVGQERKACKTKPVRDTATKPDPMNIALHMSLREKVPL
eukprot:6492259-Amphidinium_carterae.2